ncbi:MAG: hypothetical protein KAH32_06095, partial [Chlamydiia bacterium]|nr:hypothetical protein [Chlamydiia bacterium]
PKRPKLKVIFRGALVGKAPEIFIFKDMKELRAKEAVYRGIYQPEVIEFIYVPGMIQIKDKPQELVGTVMMEGQAIETVFTNAPNWAKRKDTIWGQGFENTWYIAPPDFSEVVKLKKKKS